MTTTGEHIETGLSKIADAIMESTTVQVALFIKDKDLSKDETELFLDFVESFKRYAKHFNTYRSQ